MFPFAHFIHMSHFECNFTERQSNFGKQKLRWIWNDTFLLTFIFKRLIQLYPIRNQVKQENPVIKLINIWNKFTLVSSRRKSVLTRGKNSCFANALFSAFLSCYNFRSWQIKGKISDEIQFFCSLCFLLFKIIQKNEEWFSL